MLKEILDKTTERIGKELTNQPEVEMKLLATLADTYIDLRLPDELETVARRELDISRSQLKGQESLSTATGLSHLGATFFYRGNFEQARSLFRKP